MTDCPCLPLVNRAFPKITAAARMAAAAMLLAVLFHGAGASASDAKPHATASPCAFSDAEFDTTTDVRALDEYGTAIAQLLK